jgi:hypothetical protein
MATNGSTGNASRTGDAVAVVSDVKVDGIKMDSEAIKTCVSEFATRNLYSATNMQALADWFEANGISYGVCGTDNAVPAGKDGCLSCSEMTFTGIEDSLNPTCTAVYHAHTDPAATKGIRCMWYDSQARRQRQLNTRRGRSLAEVTVGFTHKPGLKVKSTTSESAASITTAVKAKSDFTDEAAYKKKVKDMALAIKSNPPSFIQNVAAGTTVAQAFGGDASVTTTAADFANVLIALEANQTAALDASTNMDIIQTTAVPTAASTTSSAAAMILSGFTVLGAALMF